MARTARGQTRVQAHGHERGNGGGATWRLRVLVVEDDEHIRGFERLTLEACGYEVLEAPNGVVALDLAAAHPPDVIVLDINMPVMDGRAFAAAYRAGPGPHAPMIVTTAGGFAELHGAAVGAETAIGKPFDLDHLCDAVARCAIRPAPAAIPGPAAR